MSNAPSPSSTTSFQSTESQDGGPSNPSQSPVGSPPLILAFLAIGIFSAAMIAVFGWRRVQFGRDAGLWRYRDDTRSEGRRGRGSDPAGPGDVVAATIVGEKPVLWEARTDRSTKVERGDYGCWDNVMPLALVSSPALTSNKNSSSSSLSDSGPPRLPEPPPIFRLQQTTSSQRPSRRRQRMYEIPPLSIFRRRIPTNTAPNVQLDSIGQGHSSGKAKEDEKLAQVVMIIEMPSPTKSRYRHAQSSERNRHLSRYSSHSNSETLVDSTGRMREDPGIHHDDSGQFQYCLGVHTCPWPQTTTLPLMSNNGPERIPQPHPEKEIG